jgi:hypothetical protein
MSDCPDACGVDAKRRQDYTQELKKNSIRLPVTRPERKNETADHANDYGPNQKLVNCLLASWVFFPHIATRRFFYATSAQSIWPIRRENRAFSIIGQLTSKMK